MSHIFRDGEGVIHDQCIKCGAAQIDQGECRPEPVQVGNAADELRNCSRYFYPH